MMDFRYSFWVKSSADWVKVIDVVSKDVVVVKLGSRPVELATGWDRERIQSSDARVRRVTLPDACKRSFRRSSKLWIRSSWAAYVSRAWSVRRKRIAKTWWPLGTHSLAKSAPVSRNQSKEGFTENFIWSGYLMRKFLIHENV
jgi:hypothetical protein